MDLLIEQKRSKIVDIYLELFFLPLEGCITGLRTFTLCWNLVEQCLLLTFFNPIKGNSSFLSLPPLLFFLHLANKLYHVWFWDTILKDFLTFVKF